MSGLILSLLRLKELGHLCKLKEEFDSRQVKILTVSPDTSECGGTQEELAGEYMSMESMKILSIVYLHVTAVAS